MRDYDEYHQILELWERGIAKKRIATTLAIPRATVRDCIERYSTLKGLEENRERASKSTSYEVLQRICDSNNSATQWAYAYVLGMYLGDGYIRRFVTFIELESRWMHVTRTSSKPVPKPFKYFYRKIR